MDWANKAEALASYAKMAADESLQAMAQRVRARALRRVGELLKEYEAPGARTDLKPLAPQDKRLTKGDAAKDAGLSPKQTATAVRVANVPADRFEKAVEAPKPATVTQLAKEGTKPRPLVDMGSRDPGTERLPRRWLAPGARTPPAPQSWLITGVTAPMACASAAIT